jgi:hypothetical protein
MSEIKYVVAVTFADPVRVEPWLDWLRQGHIAEVLNGGATQAEIVVLDSPAHTYEVHYRFPSRAAFESYERDHAPRLRAEDLSRFPTSHGMSYRRSVGVVTDGFPRGLEKQ